MMGIELIGWDAEPHLFYKSFGLVVNAYFRIKIHKVMM